MGHDIEFPTKRSSLREVDKLIWFLISLIALWCMMPIHFLSVEHQKLEKKYGEKRGIRIGGVLGMISGWGFFISLAGIWISPQPSFTIPFLQVPRIPVPVVGISISLFHMVVFIPFLLAAAWFGIVGVRATGIRVAETHKPEKVISTGVYSRMRHPQYFGAIVAHIGFSILLSALYSLLCSPMVILYNYLVARKEEKELTREFGKEYENYRKRTPMLLPRIR